MDCKTQLFFFHFHCQTRTTACSLHLAGEEMTTATIDKQLQKKTCSEPTAVCIGSAQGGHLTDVRCSRGKGYFPSSSE